MLSFLIFHEFQNKEKYHRRAVIHNDIVTPSLLSRVGWKYWKCNLFIYVEWEFKFKFFFYFSLGARPIKIGQKARGMGITLSIKLILNFQHFQPTLFFKLILLTLHFSQRVISKWSSFKKEWQILWLSLLQQIAQNSSISFDTQTQHQEFYAETEYILHNELWT